MIIPARRARQLARPFELSDEAKSRLFLMVLVMVVTCGFVVSLLAPMIFAPAFRDVRISPSQLTSFMNGW